MSLVKLALGGGLLLLYSTFAPADVIRDGTLGPGVEVQPVGPDYLIPSTMGEIVGGRNLFHSFSEFSLGLDGNGDRQNAEFSGPDSIENLLIRVTGDQRSDLDGRLRSTIFGANVFFMNPNGVIFGPDATLDVRGTFAVTTSDYLRLGSLAGGGIFHATQPELSLLSFEDPSAYGFVGAPEPIEVHGSRLEAPSINITDPEQLFEGVAFVGGDLLFEGRGVGGSLAYLSSQVGQIELVSVASPGEALITESGIEVDGFSELGDIKIVDDFVVSSGGVSPGAGLLNSIVLAGAGDINVRGGSLLVEDSEIRAFTGGSLAGGTVDIDVTGDVVLRRVVSENRVGIDTQNGVQTPFFFFGGTGAAGDVLIAARNILLENGAVISSVSKSDGPGGAIELRAEESIEIVGRGPGGIRSALFVNAEGTREAGSILLQAPRIELADEAAVVAETRNDAGDAGEIVVNARELILTGNARIDSSTRGTGDGGEIFIGRDQPLELLRISGRTSDEEFSGITALSQPGAQGPAGSIDIRADTVEIFDGGEISSGSLSDALAGSVTLEVGDLVLSSGTIATSAPLSDGGDINITASNGVTLRDGSRISASVGGGEGGSVTISEPEFVLLRDASVVSASAATSPGTGGRIEFTTGAFFAAPDSQVTASAPGGPEFQGTVEITSPVNDLESQLSPLQTKFLDAASKLQPTCAARTGAGPVGTFTVSSHPGLPAAPDGPLIAFEDIGPIDADLLTAVAAKHETVSAANRLLTAGAHAFRSGHFAEAEVEYLRASDLYAAVAEPAARVAALRGLAQSQLAKGRYAESAKTLNEAVSVARTQRKPISLASLYGSLGNAYLALGQVDKAEEYLRKAIDFARQSSDPGLARLHNNLGNLHATQQQLEAALAAYAESARLAGEARWPEEQARALANAALTALEASQTSRAWSLMESASTQAAELSASHASVSIWIQLGSSYMRLADSSTSHREDGLLSAHRELSRAVSQAKELGDDRALSYALGYLGSLYQRENRIREALYLTREALQVGEKAASESVYRWNYQEGELLWALGRPNQALASYGRAVRILEKSRQETLAQYGSPVLHFRRMMAPAYITYTDALLRASDLTTESADRKRLWIEARATMEAFKAAELRDYFRDMCVADFEARKVDLDLISRETRAAVVYPILLPDRLELLVSLPSGLERFTVPVDAIELAAVVKAYRQKLMLRWSRFPAEAHQLYTWLVQPYVNLLSEQAVESLVFVPDGVLRTVPMAALHDGEDYLVRRYAVSVAPGLSLLDPKEHDAANAKLLAVGVSEPVQGFRALPAAREVEALHEIYGGQVLLNEAFNSARFADELESGEPALVHLASHAVFTGDAATSFVLTHDGRITMEEIAQIVAPTNYRRQPIELLTLSACETAAGDERAALGLAGVAIRSGARSALGSLWAIQDDATYKLMLSFYRELRAGSISKTEALRRAQLELLDSHRFSAPYYWSAFLLIGNWQ